MNFTRLGSVSLIWTLVLLSGCARKEVTERDRKEAAHLVSEAQFALTFREWARAEGLFAQAVKLAPTGDYWLPHGVTRAFTGAERGTDEQMLALLEPFRPHRFRVLRLLGAAGHDAPRHGPRKHTGLTPRR
jgi:outer membrane protein assembly factor BamD (BamD/ComL family)